MIEFVLAATFIFVPMLAGLATVGMSMVTANQVASLNTSAGQMISFGVDFTNSANVAILQKIAGSLNTSTSGSGAVIVSEIDYSTSNGYICSNQIIIPLNGGSVTSQYAPGQQVSSAFESLMPMSNGQIAYVAETSYNNPQLAWVSSGTGGAIFAKGVF